MLVKGVAKKTSLSQKSDKEKLKMQFHMDRDLSPSHCFSGNLPRQEFFTMVSAAGESSSKLGAVNTFLGEVAMSINCVRLTFDPIPSEYNSTFLSLSPRDAS